MATRFSSIRARITLLVLVPLLALASLWVFITGVTYGDAHQLLQSRDFQQKTVLPTQRLIDGLQKERRLSMAALGGARPADQGPLRTQRQATDKAVREVRAGSRDQGLRDSILPRVVERMDGLVGRLGDLRGLRAGVDDRTTGRERVLHRYNEIIDAGFAVYQATTPAEGSITARAQTLTSFGRAREYMAREDALLTGALAAGRITAAERAQFARLVGAHHAIHADSALDLAAEHRASFERLMASPASARLMALENAVINGAEPPPAARGQGAQQGRAGTGDVTVIEPAAWRSLFDTANGEMYELENAFLDDLTDHAHGIAVGAFTRLALAGGLGLVAIVLSSFIAVRVSRRLVRECRVLAGGVVDFTQARLPRLADSIRSGRGADPEPEFVAGYRINEIRQIAESFDRARDAVVRAAESEVAARRGISEVFVNLARRNQALLHRQLSLLDSMERRTEDPSELSDLFRLDHLATRMRRHAEGLVILAGKTAGRGWRRPVPLVDVVRGAVAEVEDYPRVRVQPLPRVALLGSAVADVIHMLAEVVENATTFSPPQSPVRVSGHQVASGFAIEVEDRGLGMTEEALRAANARLVDPPEFDPSDSAQLGLFVVARLAQRHGIQVTLRTSPYGGTTAIALIPGSLIVEAAEPEPFARRATGPMQKVPSGAPALAVSARPAVEAPRTESARTESARTESARTESARTESARTESARADSTGTDPGLVRLVGPGSAPPEPEAPAPRTGPEPAEASAEAAPEPAPPLKPGELPKRRRQQHLAPQLKKRVDERLAAQGKAPPGEPPPPAEPAGPPPAPEPAGMPLSAPVPADAAPPAPESGPAAEGPEDDARSPETMRSMMSAMQRGWQRGRQDAADAEAETARNPADQEDDTP
ncbi:sensor histidine kinase [Actinomadura sp. KC345]|uniref:sensor histidine kinase n=1 Tax=Actinomadura sp. KC345 TaxID=2530371 RepID=UPI00104DFCFF|nr:nitrate- and nitrite sensing domain-containing protein [Actinomadura sp. KC345]TDC57793.1 sensor histidine kinase [Actinomadura sp. KC345]